MDEFAAATRGLFVTSIPAGGWDDKTAAAVLASQLFAVGLTPVTRPAVLALIESGRDAWFVNSWPQLGHYVRRVRAEAQQGA